MKIYNSDDPSNSDVGIGLISQQPQNIKLMIVLMLVLSLALTFVMVGLLSLLLMLNPYLLNSSLYSSTCTINSVMNLSSVYETDNCISNIQILFVSYNTSQNKELQSTIASTDSTYTKDSIIPCDVSNTDNYYVLLPADVPDNLFIIMISLGAVGLFLTIILVGFYYKAKMFGEIVGHLTILSMIGFLVVTMLSLATLVTSLYFLGSTGNVWASYQAGQCNVTNISYKVEAKYSSKGGCYTIYTLDETVLILNTNTVAQLVSSSSKKSSYVNDGRKVGGTYPCFYHQSDVVYSRDPYYPYIISGIIGLILTIWSFTQLVPAVRIWYNTFKEMMALRRGLINK